jgi:hypothetical protein
MNMEKPWNDDLREIAQKLWEGEENIQRDFICHRSHMKSPKTEHE